MTGYELNRDDSELLARLIAGEVAAFEQLIRHFHHPMKRVAQAIIGEAQAEEVVQEAWLAVIKSLQDFQRRSSLKTWLFTIVANEAKSRLRKGKREVSIEDVAGNGGLYEESRWLSDGHWVDAPGEWHDNSPEVLLSYEDFRKCLDKTLAKLPDDQKAVLTLREYQGLELEEICNILDVSASNVRVLIHRARAKVYAMVEHFEETGKC